MATVLRTTLQRVSLHTRSAVPLAMAKRPVMEQVEVDEPHVQQQLGKIQVIFGQHLMSAKNRSSPPLVCKFAQRLMAYPYYPQQMDLVKKAEEMKMNHADKHRKHRRKGPSSNDVLELLKSF